MRGEERGASDGFSQRMSRSGVLKTRGEELRQELDIGLAALERGDVVTLEGGSELHAFFDDIFARGHERLAAQRSATP